MINNKLWPNKIITSGDIHIFQNKRFEEHKYIFKKFYAEIDREQPEVIVLTGDIIDSKNKLSPEQIDICRDFFVELASRATVVLINGNHDMNYNNQERLDALTPIINSLQGITAYDIWHLKTSEIHDIGYPNLKFAVWSWFENNADPFLHESAKYITDDDYVIGLFHGVIEGATNSDGFKLSGGTKISEFDKCHIVMASDIHHQSSFRNGEINYTGSLLQVSVNENPAGSYLVYDKTSDGYDVRVNRINNEFATITVNAEDDLTGFVINNKIRLKFDTETISRVKAIEMAKELKNKFNTSVNVVPIIKKKSKLNTQIVKNNDIDLNNITDYFNEFIKKNSEKLDIKNYDEDLKSLLAFDKIFSTNEIKDFEDGDFSADRMIINNIFSYSDTDNEIPLDHEGLVGILGNNRVGKSSIIKSIQFVFFNEVPNNLSAVKILNKHNRDKIGYVEIYVNKANKHYKIKRIITPKKKGGADISLFFYEVDLLGNEINNLSKESRPTTDTEIKKYFGINDYFEMLSLFSAQKKQVEFIDCKNADRLKLINKFLGLQSFEAKEENLKEELKDQNTLYNNLLKQFDKDFNLPAMELQLRKSELQLNFCSISETDINEEIADANYIYKDLLNLYNSNLKTANKNIPEPIELNNKKDKIELDIINLNDIKLNIESEMIDLKKTEKSKELEFKEFVGCAFDDFEMDSDKSIKKRREELKAQVAVNQYEIKKINKQINIDICDSCGQKFNDSDKEKLKEKLVLLNKEIDECDLEITEIEDNETQINERISILHKAVKQYTNKQLELIEIQSKLVNLNFEINNINTLLNEYNTVQKSKIIVDSLDKKVAEYNDIIKTLNLRMSDNKMMLGYHINQIKEINSKIKIYKEKIVELESIENNIRLLKAYRKIVNKDGLPLYILNSKIDEINDKINMIVNQIFDFNVEFLIDEEKGDLKIQFTYKDDKEANEVALASGAETFIINLCVKVALSQISKLPKIDTLFIDEGYDVLDKETIDKLSALFYILNNYYKNIITITHLDEIKDLLAYKIELERDNTYTKIVST